MPNIDRVIQFLFEVGCARHTMRTWHRFGGLPVANLAEHTMRVAFIAYTLHVMEKKGDLGKILLMALLHDIPELRTEDVNYLTRMYTKRDEDRAMQDAVHGTPFAASCMDLFKEYEARLTIEAQIVKDADLIDQLLEKREMLYVGVKVPPSWLNAKKTYYTASALKLIVKIKRSNPQDWHTLKHNRIVDGDWKPKKVMRDKRVKRKLPRSK